MQINDLVMNSMQINDLEGNFPAHGTINPNFIFFLWLEVGPVSF